MKTSKSRRRFFNSLYFRFCRAPVRGRRFFLFFAVCLLFVRCTTVPPPEGTAAGREKIERAETETEAEKAKPAWYVSASGNDEADGLGGASAFRTLGRAVRAAKTGHIQRIAVLGTLNAESEAVPAESPCVFDFSDTGLEELVISGAGESPAVLSAEAAGRRVLAVSGVSRLRFENITISGGRALLPGIPGGLSGGGLYIHSGACVTLGSGARVVSNTAVYGAGGAVWTEGQLILEEGALIANNATSSFEYMGTAAAPAGGGVLVSRQASLVMRGGEISGNTAHHAGAGVAVQDGGGFTLADGRISGNSVREGGSGRGGVVFAGGDSVFTMTGGEISRNVPPPGDVSSTVATAPDGAVHIQGGSRFVMEGGRITENVLKNDWGSGVFAEGGAEFILNGGIISGHLSVSGGVRVDEASFIMTGGEISENSSLTAGGGVWLNAGKFILSGGDLIRNKARLPGGGVYLSNGSSLVMRGGGIKENEARRGGGIMAEDGSGVVMEGGRVAGNRAFLGGGMALAGDSSLTMRGGELSGNRAAQGGGLWAEGARCTLTAAALITGNSAEEYGGGVYAGENKVFAFEGGAIAYNWAGKHGGGIYLRGTDSSFYFLSGGSLNNNEARGSGGGLYSEYAKWMITGTDIRANIAENSGGGAVFSGGVCGFRAGSVSGNIAGASGGGLCVLGAAAFTFEDGEVRGNKAGGGGGGISVEDGSFVMIAGEINDNEAALGGGLYLASADNADGKLRSSAMTGGIVRGNLADSGGGIAVTRYLFTLGGNAVVSGNHAREFGGGVYVFLNTFSRELSSAVFFTLEGNAAVSGNASRKFGGGVYIATSKFLMIGGSVSWNTAGEYGGGVVAADWGTGRGEPVRDEFVLRAGSITGNSAPKGGGVYVSPAADFKYPLSGSLVVSNEPEDIYYNEKE